MNNEEKRLSTDPTVHTAARMAYALNEYFHDWAVAYRFATWLERNWHQVEVSYEFRCPSFVYAGPGHQSRHECEIHRPHPIDGGHEDRLYEWEGTSVEEVVDGRRRLVSNAKYRGDGRCGH